MRLFTLLPEAIESPRAYFHQKLVDNKDVLQQAKTRLGVTRALKRIFPDVDFKMFSTGPYAAGYTPEKGVVVGNQNKLMSGKTVRNNWPWFLKTMTDLLTHEFIHKEQASRRGIDGQVSEKPTVSKTEINKLRQQMMNLQADYHEYLNRGKYDEADKIQKEITKLKRSAEKQNFHMYGTRRDYLGDRDEITAYAEGIASTLITQYRNQGYQGEQLKQKVIADLKNPTESNNRDLLKYLNAFRGTKNKPVQQLLKQSVLYVEKNLS